MVVLELVAAARPDVILMDVRMPEMDGLEATRRILGGDGYGGGEPAPKVVILTTFGLDEYVFAALQAGASGFLRKDTEPTQLIEAVRVGAGGDALLAPTVTRRLIAEFVQYSRPVEVDVSSLADLTEREREVLGLVGRRLSNQEIADHLVISPATTKTHVSRVMAKLDAHDRAQLVILAYESGLIAPRY